MKDNNSKKLNAVPKFLFTPFSRSSLYISLINFLNMGLIIYCGFKVDFKPSDLSNLSQLTLNLVFVIGAIGLSIFSLNLEHDPKNVQNDTTKKELVHSYIGIVFTCSSIAVLSYILSLLDLTPFINKSYSLVVLFILLSMISSTLATIVAYFNIR